MQQDDDRGIGDAARRVVDYLKRHAPATAASAAESLGVTPTAVRSHLDELARRGLVESKLGFPSGRGRPPTLWVLSELAIELFPDRHSDLTIELLDAIRASVGEDGLLAVLAERNKGQLADLRHAMADDADLTERAETLARQRTAQGYMAELVDDGDALLLIEHHCPVCDAAAACQGFCASELELFQRALGNDADVERTQHLLSGDQRCVYRIRSRS